MLKAKYKIGLGLLITAASALSACGKKGDDGKVVFWSSFGSSYTDALNRIVDQAASEAGIEIDHKPQGSYDEIYRNMQSAIGPADYPNLAIGYPDHFASYLGSGILTALDEYFSEAELDDYYDFYMKENIFYDNGRSKAAEKIYGIPFNKSTELLGYNGTFVDYCLETNETLRAKGLPKTWQDWIDYGPTYNQLYVGLMGNGLYGNQDVFGNGSDFEVHAPVEGVLPGTEDEDGDKALDNGKKLLLDLTKVNTDNSILMGWDATDNAFITLLRQWGSGYTYVDPSENTKIASRRVGSVLFNKTSKEAGETQSNQDKAIDMLMTFNRLNKAHIFGTPQTPLNADYCSVPFENCRCMFMICSSGGLSHTTANWHYRFRVAPLPYKDEQHKAVISQGANICMTNQGNFESSVKAIKALTTGKFQTKWCLDTGYYPCSKSAAESSEYQAFVHEAQKKVGDEWVDLNAEEAAASGAYSSAIRVAYREGSLLNENYYMKASEGWDKFVDPAFDGSSDLRDAVKTIFDSVLSIKGDAVEDRDQYKSKLLAIENFPKIKSSSNISFVH